MIKDFLDMGSMQCWGNEGNPFEQLITLGNEGTYGSYGSGLPNYPDVEELQEYYLYLKEFAKWAIENKVCYKCRWPWYYDSVRECTCHKYSDYHEKIDKASLSATKIIEYDRIKIQEWANRIEKDLRDDSEYAELNRKSRFIMDKTIERYNENKKLFEVNEKVGFFTHIFQKKTWGKWIRNILNLINPYYWKWKSSIIKEQKVKSIPLKFATENQIKEMSYGSKNNGLNCYIKTKSGSVIVMPVNQIDKLRNKYDGAEIIEAKIKS